MVKGRLNTITLHCIGWLVFFSLPVIFIIGSSNADAHFFSGDDLLSLLGFAIYIPIFYLNTYYLFPRLFSGGKRVLYFFSIAILFGVVYYLEPFEKAAFKSRSFKNVIGIQATPAEILMDESGSGGHKDDTPPFGPGGFVMQRSPNHIDIISIALFLIVMVLSIALILEQRWRNAVQETARAEADKANAELSFLKAQINPHFLFNTLNNIYSLAITKNENVADAIMKLSNLMRYVTDDVNEDFVALEREMDSINDYISLQRLRLGKKVTIEYVVEGNTSSKIISPLLLMPFVENAFKHGISNSAESTIVVRLTASEKYIVFYTENRLFATPRNVERTGIGNTNTKKRLARIYPGKYMLDIGPQNGLFTVHLVMYI